MTIETIELNPGTGGDLVAVDTIGGKSYQIVKIDVGADGSEALLGSSNPIPVSDAGGTLTVDGTVAVTNAGLTELAAAINGSSQMDVNIAASGATLTVASHAVTNAGTFATQVDGAALTALQLIDNIVAVEDAVAGSGYSGVPFLAVRQDSHSALAADGDFISPTIDADGGLRVSIVAGAGSGGTAVADDADFTDGTTSLTPIGGVYESTPSSVTDGDIGMAGITSTRALRVAIDSGGVAGRAEDSAHSSGHEGIVMLAVRRDSAAVGSDTDGDYSTINVNSAGRVYTSSTIDAALPAGTNAIGKLAANSGVDIGDVDVTSLPNVTLAAGTNTNEVVGDVAHDAAAAGNPVQTGGYATNNIEGVTQVAAGDLTRTVHDLNGVQVVRPHTTLEEIQSVRTTNTDGNSTSLVAAAGSGVHNYLSAITIWNSSSTDGFVDLRDGTAGSVLYTVPAPQTGGAHITFPVPLKFGDNTAIAFDASGAITTIYISAVFFQAQG
jgi:hypothetical protein